MLVSSVRDLEADMIILIKEIATKTAAIDRMRNFLSTFLCMSLLRGSCCQSQTIAISAAQMLIISYIP